MNRDLGHFSLGVLSALCLLAVTIFFGIVPGYTRYSGPTVVAEVVSPDSRYVARSERMSNNNDWCEERTTVDPVGTRSDWERDYVFLNRCGMPVNFEWTDNRRLRITYGYDDQGKAHIYRRPFSNDQQVSIEYRVEDEGSQ